ncbi:hypothetical protein SEA_GALACTICA_64 [Streptomyces phage Galactica]|nr:hypothetical protein SEA_GALACTICA_64 [Streptomyces phage Galactica]
MGLRDMVLPKDTQGNELLRDWDRANEAAADVVNTGGELAFVDVQIGYRLKGAETYLREEPIRQVAPGAVDVINKLAMYLHCTYVALSVQVRTGGGYSRFVNIKTNDILYVEVRVQPHETEPQDEQRRSKLRGHGN